MSHPVTTTGPAESSLSSEISVTTPSPSWSQRLLSTEAASVLVVVGSLVFAYWPSIVDLVATWQREPDYSHGFLVIPIAALIMYRLWPRTAEDQPRLFWPALSLVILGFALRAFFQSRGNFWSLNATMLIVIFGLALSGLGLRNLRSTWPAFAFLIFLLPLPLSVNNSLSQPLRTLATKASAFVLRTTGLWVMVEGNVIVVGGEPLEVAEACNGLSMLMSLAATVAAAAALIPMAPFKRVILILSIAPVALVSNVLRISATAWCYHLLGAKLGGEWAHDLAGYLMMPLAMALVGLELWLLSLIVVETTENSGTGLRFDHGLASGNRPGLGATR